MRDKFDEQLKFYFLIPNNKLGRELEGMSNVLSENKQMLDISSVRLDWQV